MISFDIGKYAGRHSRFSQFWSDQISRNVFVTVFSWWL